jgi:hypothetical protein
MQLTERVQVVIEVTEPDGTVFRDALYMSAIERAALTEDDIKARGQARHAAWKAATSAPPRQITRAEKRDMLEAAIREKARLAEEIAAADPADLAAVRARPGVPQDSAVLEPTAPAVDAAVKG